MYSTESSTELPVYSIVSPISALTLSIASASGTASFLIVKEPSMSLVPDFLAYVITPAPAPIVPPAIAPAAAASPNCFQKSFDEYKSPRLAPSFNSAAVDVITS